MAIGFGELIDLESDSSFSNTARLLALKYAVDIHTGKVVLGEKEKQLATHFLKGCAVNVLVAEMNKLIIAHADEIFPDVSTKQELISGLYNGKLIPVLDAAIKKNWSLFATLFAPVATGTVTATTSALKL